MSRLEDVTGKDVKDYMGYNDETGMATKVCVSLKCKNAFCAKGNVVGKTQYGKAAMSARLTLHVQGSRTYVPGFHRAIPNTSSMMTTGKIAEAILEGDFLLETKDEIKERYIPLSHFLMESMYRNNV